MKRKQRYSFITILVILLSFTGCTKPAETQTENTETIDAVQLAELVKHSDDLYAQREDLGKLREALKLLRRARGSDPQNFEVQWRISRADYFLGDNTADEKESAKAFKEGVDAGKAARALEKNRAEGYFWYGANLGGQSENDTLTGLTSIGDIRDSMNKVIEIDPSFEGASAFDALAQVEMGTRLTGGSNEKAVEYLQKGMQYSKDNSYIYEHLAEAYVDMSKKAEAKKQIDTLLKLRPYPGYEPEHKKAVEEAKKLLETRF
jgi:tetratricopeptide (TPR) repeat protein